ncbi:hypothetical protein C2E20_7735 [Micractinium conductrix]|uniref:Uncharacterized protein n=1 Tax=Micractinium conductrix TaxID=554055 RepID=A0A2P6V3M0_9CHLO|nr:hypothetical protein C2E20_7735 [Micractinium conductrix]|eukprot:PSC68678.1 hypothetical protein C2E20_7735 [Micractinium conductrix]
MQGGAVLAQAAGRAGRRLLADGCTPLGGVGVGGSIALLLLIGFVLGGGAASLFFWWHQRRAMRIELEYRDRFGETVRTGVPDVAALVKAAHAHNISRADCAALTAGADVAPALGKGAPTDGPLALGAASSFKTRDADALRGEMSLKEQRAPNSGDHHHTNPLAYGTSLARSSSGNPFASSAMLPGFNVRRNMACSLNTTLPSACSSHSSPDRPQASGLIGTSVHMPAADPASPRITKPQPAAQPAPAASPFNWPSLTGQQAAAASEQQQQAAQQAAQQAPAHIRSDTVVVVPADGAPVAAVPLPAAPAVQRGRSSDYLAALDSAATNPFETPALRQQQEEEGGLAGAFGGAAGAAGAAAPSTAAAVGGAAAPAAAAAAKAAEKQELLQQVQGEEYGDEELDPEWTTLLGDLDARLQASGRRALSARERAVAIRSLIVATASQSVDAALNKAQHDVESFRRVQAARSAAA